MPPEPEINRTEFDHCKLRGWTHRQSLKNTEQTCREPECEALESPKSLPEYIRSGAIPYAAVHDVPIIIEMPECLCSCHREKGIRKIMELLLMHAFLVMLICGFVLVLI